MVSIIVCSIDAKVFGEFEQNISATAGVPFEIIRIDNSSNAYSICNAYNEGAAKAKYQILCFAHEDIEMQTMNWGGKAVELFNQNKSLGLLGVAGSGYKPLSPSGWWYENANPKVFFTNYIQSNKTGDKSELMYSNPANKNLSAVVCIDGFWFCTRRHIAIELRFDDRIFKGFHCYDIDYSLRVFQQYKVAVGFEILIKHYSEGSLSVEWINDTLKLNKKWENTLPLSTVNLNRQILKQEEIVSLDYFVKQMLQYPFPIKQIFFLLWSSKVKSLIGFAAFIKLNFNIVRYIIYHK